jgi:bifunctional ADP-heptose synthase (sugar kinase/adenylyltransferase)
MMVASDGAARHVPAPPVDQPIDIVGAGDSAMAAIGAALASGAHPLEAAQLGNLAAAVTIRKLGTTGTASAAEILARWDTA